LSQRKVEIEIDRFKMDKASRTQRAVIEFYKQIDEVIEPNHYDEWVMYAKDDHRKVFGRVQNFFSELGEILGILDHDSDYETVTGTQKILFDLCALYLRDRDNVKRNIRGFINMRWNLIEVEKRSINVEVTQDLQEDILDKITVAKITTVESIADTLSNVVFVPREIWEYVLYSVLSTNSPDIIINGIPQRGNLHTNFIGEISTAKSTILRVLKMIAPRWLAVTKSTEASFEGISKAKEIAQGIVESANGGILIVPEFRTAISKFQLLRETMDCDFITIYKRGIEKTIKVNTSFIAASNPKNDFFPESGKFRDEIPFEEGVLSRFDFLIPLITDQEKNKKIVGQLSLFGGEVDRSEFDDMKEILRILGEGMSMVSSIRISKDQETILKNAYLKHNKKLGNRTLVILRDLETLARMVNVIVASNFFNRSEVEQGIYQAEDVDITKAIYLWDNLIYLRKQLYQNRSDKMILSTTEKIYQVIAESEKGMITMLQLQHTLTDAGICSRASMYRYIKTLESRGAIKYIDKDTEKATIKVV